MISSFLIFLMLLISVAGNAQNKKPFRIGIAGLTHTHVHWLLGRADDGDIQITGISEPNRELAERYLKQYNLSLTLLYSSLEEMLDKTRPEAIAAFNPIDEHLDVVKICAPRKIHVMVEKPLAATLDQARQMEALAIKYKIQLLTNYETTWYGSNHEAYKISDTIGNIRKVVVHDGHQGPKEIGVNKEFLDWLTDPVKNGGGALMDFGCYGANLITWLMKGERPIAVVAITQQIKPDIYPKVEDEATIIVTYPRAQGIIQASWNWPYSRKDMEIYGERGYIMADRNGLKIKTSGEQPEIYQPAVLPIKPLDDPFAYLAAVARSEIIINPADLSSLQNNMIVMEILEAAKQSARQGKVIYLK